MVHLGTWRKLMSGKGNHTSHTYYRAHLLPRMHKRQLSHACSEQTGSIWREPPRQAQQLLGLQHCVLATRARDLVCHDCLQPPSPCPWHHNPEDAGLPTPHACCLIYCPPQPASRVGGLQREKAQPDLSRKPQRAEVSLGLPLLNCSNRQSIFMM